MYALFLVTCDCNFREGTGIVAVNMLDSDIAVSDFDLKSRYYAHFRTSTLGKGCKIIRVIKCSSSEEPYTCTGVNQDISSCQITLWAPNVNKLVSCGHKFDGN